MVLDLRYRLEHLALRLCKRVLVQIAEAVVVVSEPEAEHHGVTVLRSLVQLRLRLARAPRAERIAADLLEERLRPATAAAVDEIRLAVARQAPRALRAFDLDDGPGSEHRNGRNADCECKD